MWSDVIVEPGMTINFVAESFIKFVLYKNLSGVSKLRNARAGNKRFKINTLANTIAYGSAGNCFS
jgi:hypothetical protein